MPRSVGVALRTASVSNPDVPLLVLLWVEPSWESFKPFCSGVSAQQILWLPHLLWARSFPCDRVELGKESPDISAGKCAPGAITSRVCNCLLTANIQACPYQQRNMPRLLL